MWHLRIYYGARFWCELTYTFTHHATTDYDHPHRRPNWLA